MPIDESTRREFEAWGKTPPTSEAHGTDETIRAQLTPLKTRSWRLQGNQLIADTELGELVQLISPDYILTGIDASGMPILTRIG
jgi:hypothetical protein